MERLYYTLGANVQEKEARHIMRYNFVGEQLKGKKELNILDFGCGSGYGSKLLSLACPNSNIVGYDISKEAIEYAEQNNSNLNILFTTDKQMLEKKYDVIIMMDCIEHLEQKEIDKILNLLTKNKKAKFFISTPLSSFNGLSPTNKYHINCFTRDRFNILLDLYFKKYSYWLIDWYFSRKMSDLEKYGGVITVCEELK